MRPLAKDTYRVVPGTHYGTPKEVWGFRSGPVPGAPRAGAQAFLRANEELLGLRGIRGQLGGRPLVLESLGARHVILQQRFEGARIHRAYVTVHVGRRDRRIYLVKNRAVPRDLLPEPERPRRSLAQAERRAVRSIRAARGRVLATRLLQHELLWFPSADELRSRGRSASPRCARARGGASPRPTRSGSSTSTRGTARS